MSWTPVTVFVNPAQPHQDDMDYAWEWVVNNVSPNKYDWHTMGDRTIFDFADPQTAMMFKLSVPGAR